jgi:hypothetical protein
MEPKFVSCIWLDAVSESTNTATLRSVEEDHHPARMETVGWLLREDERGVSIFNERCLDGEEIEYRDRTFIPRGMIQSLTEYKLTKPRQPRKPPADGTQ